MTGVLGRLFGRRADPEPARADELPAVRALEEGEAVDLGRRDLWELLRAVDEAVPADCTLRLEDPAGREVVSLLEERAVAADSRTHVYDLSLAGDDLAALRALAERHAAPEVCMHFFVHRDGEPLVKVYDCGEDTWVVRTLPEDVRARFEAVPAR